MFLFIHGYWGDGLPIVQVVPVPVGRDRKTPACSLVQAVRHEDPSRHSASNERASEEAERSDGKQLGRLVTKPRAERLEVILRGAPALPGNVSGG